MTIQSRARQLQSLAEFDTHEGRIAAERLERLLKKHPTLSLERLERVSIPLMPVLGKTNESQLLVLAIASGFDCKVYQSDSWVVSGVAEDVEEVEGLYYKSARLLGDIIDKGRTSDWSEALIQGFRHGIRARLGGDEKDSFDQQSPEDPTNIYVGESGNFAGTSAYKQGRRKALLVELKEKR